MTKQQQLETIDEMLKLANRLAEIVAKLNEISKKMMDKSK